MLKQQGCSKITATEIKTADENITNEMPYSSPFSILLRQGPSIQLHGAVVKLLKYRYIGRYCIHVKNTIMKRKTRYILSIE